MTAEERAAVEFLRGSVCENRFVPDAHRFPHPKQVEFLVDRRREVLFGGSVGGGKTEALLLAALQFVDVPGYAALILRRTYQDLALPDAIMDRAIQWLRPQSSVKWNADTKTFAFPSGATVSFGYLASRDDHLRYQGAALQSVLFDELTQFPDERQYRYLFSRLRRLEGRNVPLRMRAASNPGGPGHGWVQARFLDSASLDCGFIASRLADNPSLDQREYLAALSHLDPFTRRQLEEGDWNARREGGLFRREWFVSEDEPPPLPSIVRWWDLAAGGSDWNVGLKAGVDEQRRYHVLDVRRVQVPPADLERIIAETARDDGPGCVVLFGEEPGSAGIALVDHYRRNVLPFVRVESVRETGSKWVRALPFAGQAHAGNIFIPARGSWLGAFLDELGDFTEDERAYAHDDQVDAFSGALGYLANVSVRFPPAPRSPMRSIEDEFRDDLRRFGLAPGGTGARPPIFG